MDQLLHGSWPVGNSILFLVVLLVLVFGVFPLVLGWLDDRWRTRK